ncbi:DotU family type IV/VI secretion system protein [Geomonas nitrogeniifigens]|uniref:DotU family type IV/VI secretion system protein n=1 Tax=Geomonas diazotrophica TaxID=2843197 RepID=A0ABX8JT57_9BACT|nr:DotU family type IV/VI secretion system protein [Geomonas nitrogeniifigens]QWV98595.1 DotU family type IV/VI secretion system protein [Geomonas nitrogeniifigens]QXE87771.1 DotU family type IV/VI secretion system protein [Geomonas nitrogeniifigens]
MRVIDCFMPLLAHVVEFRNALPQCPTEYARLKGEIRQLLAQSEALSQGAGCDPEQFDQARFIVCAWVDETLLASEWPDRQLWQHEQLQRLFYKTTDAGVEAFERLDALGEQKEAHEVYCICLALGFRGRYIGEQGEYLLEQLRTAHLKRFLGGADTVPALDGLTLFPDSLPGLPATAVRARQPVFATTPWSAVLVAAPVILFVVLYLVYRYVLNGLVLPNL